MVTSNRTMPDRSNTERVAIVTGAGRGIGEACARTLASSSFRVALMSPSDRCVQLANELDGLGMQGSVLNEGDVSSLVSQTMQRFGRVDAVVTNMGHVGGLPRVSKSIGFNPNDDFDLLSIGDQVWHDGLETYFLSIVRMARAVGPVMKRQGGGSLVNISSRNALEPYLSSPISVVRGALHGFCKLFADRYASDNIRMNNLLPGVCEHSNHPESAFRSIPMGRPARLDEIGQACVFLASPASSYITGQSILVDGGFNRGIR